MTISHVYTFFWAPQFYASVGDYRSAKLLKVPCYKFHPCSKLKQKNIDVTIHCI